MALNKLATIVLSFLLLTLICARGGAMENPENKVKYLKDYTPANFTINSTSLTIDLKEEFTLVTSELTISRSSGSAPNEPLILDGEELELVEVILGETTLKPTDYKLTKESLIIETNLDNFTIKITNKILPQNNTSLDGFYKAGDDLYLTQCEPTGFRKITYFIDRPDVMSVFTTKIIAGNNFPVLLSNGDMIDQGALEDGRHFATWFDKTKKPSYLFALVVGDLKVLNDNYTTKSGNKVDLKIYAPEKDIKDTKYAMDSLIASMRWDEATYGLEYDLGTYMIVSTPKFNMGAMENKGLNIFNNKYVLASKDSATDTNFEDVRGVIGHEYFHNWTGNRVTLRDWFQLSLKEGLTVFRDQEFTADEFSRTVKRIEDAKTIRAIQFQEDSGPLSHPVRPESYIKMDNFYTVTVYEKGAEVIRMIKTIIGDDNFFKAINLYLTRHDGQGVTTDDFVKAMEDTSEVDLTQFKLWYSQSGTPIVDISSHYNKEKKSFNLKIKQTSDTNPLHSSNKPFYIPIKTGLIGKTTGNSLSFTYNGKNATEFALVLNNAFQEFEFSDVNEEPIPSLFRDFSAPVKVIYPYTSEQLIFLLEHDNNEFNKWDAGQKYYTKFLLSAISGVKEQNGDAIKIARTMSSLIKNTQLDKAFVAMAIILPGLTEISEMLAVIDPDKIYNARKTLVKAIGKEIKQELIECYKTLQSELQSRPYSLTKFDIAARSLKNVCLSYLSQGDAKLGDKLAEEQLENADNLTDRIAALSIIKDTEDDALFNKVFGEFYNKWQGDDLIVQKWFALQATSERLDTPNKVNSLLKHHAFDINTPNHIYALIGGYGANYLFFHKIDGSGYNFIADFIIKLDATNHMIAAKMVKKFSNYKKMEPIRRDLMKNALLKIKNHPNLSDNTKEMVDLILN